MADATLSRSEVATVRRLVETLGLTEAARQLGIHPQSITVILSGREVRNGTAALVKASLPKVRA